MKRKPRTPEEIFSYGEDVIQKHRHELSDLKNERVLEVYDESNNHKFNYNDYGIWKHEVMDYIAIHEKDKRYKIDSLFSSFEIGFHPEPLSDILGILHISINHLKRKENAGSHGNSQEVQTTNKTEPQNQLKPKPIEKNPPKKKGINWKVLFWIITSIIAIIIAVIYYSNNDFKKDDVYFMAAIAGIVGTIFGILSYFKR